MTRLSIELTPEQHKRIKVLAALGDQNIKDFILERVFSNSKDDIKIIKNSMLLSAEEKNMLISGTLPDGRKFKKEIVESLRDTNFKRNTSNSFKTTEEMFKNILDEDL